MKKNNLYMAFGYTLTDKGFKQINHIGIIRGDGVDHAAIVAVSQMLMDMGYASDCIVFGSGGDLLQKLNRNTLKFAQKACAIYIHGEWKDIAKDPVTDHGKKSKEGVLTLVRSKTTGELMTARLDQGPLNEEFEDMMNLIYHIGRLFNETTLDEVRGRVN